MDKTCVMCAFLVWGPDQILGGRIKDLRIRSGDSRSISVCLPGMCVYTNEMQLSSPLIKGLAPRLVPSLVFENFSRSLRGLRSISAVSLC